MNWPPMFPARLLPALDHRPQPRHERAVDFSFPLSSAAQQRSRLPALSIDLPNEEEEEDELPASLHRRLSLYSPSGEPHQLTAAATHHRPRSSSAIFAEDSLNSLLEPVTTVAPLLPAAGGLQHARRHTLDNIHRPLHRPQQYTPTQQSTNGPSKFTFERPTAPSTPERRHSFWTLPEADHVHDNPLAFGERFQPQMSSPEHSFFAPQGAHGTPVLLSPSVLSLGHRSLADTEDDDPLSTSSISLHSWSQDDLSYYDDDSEDNEEDDFDDAGYDSGDAWEPPEDHSAEPLFFFRHPIPRRQPPQQQQQPGSRRQSLDEAQLQFYAQHRFGHHASLSSGNRWSPQQSPAVLAALQEEDAASATTTPAEDGRSLRDFDHVLGTARQQQRPAAEETSAGRLRPRSGKRQRQLSWADEGESQAHDSGYDDDDEDDAASVQLQESPRRRKSSLSRMRQRASAPPQQQQQKTCLGRPSAMEVRARRARRESLSSAASLSSLREQFQATVRENPDFLPHLALPDSDAEDDLMEDDGQSTTSSTVARGVYNRALRRHKIQAYLEKRSRRDFNRKVLYKSRKRFADSRVRIKGRFVSANSPEALALLRHQQQQISQAPEAQPAAAAR